jgi:hypothetical protein
MCFGEDKRTEPNLSTNYIKKFAKIGEPPLLELVLILRLCNSGLSFLDQSQFM